MRELVKGYFPNPTSLPGKRLRLHPSFHSRILSLIPTPFCIKPREIPSKREMFPSLERKEDNKMYQTKNFKSLKELPTLISPHVTRLEKIIHTNYDKKQHILYFLLSYVPYFPSCFLSLLPNIPLKSYI